MTTDAQLWFAIESVYVTIEDLCVRARAAQIVHESEKQSPRKAKTFKSTMVSGGDLAALRPDPVAAPNTATLAVPAGATPTEVRQARAELLARDQAFREDNVDGADLIQLRDQIRPLLRRLETQLATALSPHDLYEALFPLVVHIDEMIRVGTRGATNRWEPLQGDLYNIDNGGDRFFLVLDEKLKQIQTPPIVLEIYYFCLSEGFGGAHLGDPLRLTQYREQIAARLPVRPVPLTAATETPRAVQPVRFPWTVYAAAAALVLATHGLLSLVAPTSP